MVYGYLLPQFFSPEAETSKSTTKDTTSWYASAFIKHENQDSFRPFAFYPGIDTTDRLDTLQHPHRK